MACLVNTGKQFRVLLNQTLKILHLKSGKVNFDFDFDPTNNFPILVLYEIFSFLSLPERLKCKLVCKYWKFAVETGPGLQSLCVYLLNFPVKLKWCFSKQNVIKEETFSPYGKFRNLSSKIDLFKDLQKLCFFHVDTTEFLKDLSLLKKLKVLMIEDYYIWKENRQDDKNLHLKFDSSSLEKLSFKFFNHAYSFETPIIKSIEFNTPKLNSLVFWNDASSLSSRAKFPVSFRFPPLTIRHLECIEFNSNLSELKNLETLVCQKIVCPFSLKNFKSLQRLELFPREENELDYIKVIIGQKKSLKRLSLEILVCGFKDLLVVCTPWNPPTSTEFELNGDFFKQVVKHPDHFVGQIPWKFVLWNFQTFFPLFKQLPRDVCTQFANVWFINVSPASRRTKWVPDPFDVLQLLIQIQPDRVEIGFSFPKEFYEKLVSCQFIKDLGLREKYENLDCDLFLKLEYLESLSVRTEKLPIQFIPKLFRALVYLDSFSFWYSKFAFTIYNRQSHYTIYQHVFRKKIIDDITQMTEHKYLRDLMKDLEILKNENKPYLRNCLL